MDNRKRVAFIVRRGTFADFVVCNRSNAVSATRASSLRWPINFCTGGQLGLNEAIGIAINGTAQDAAIFASTGQICRHLFGWGDHDRFFYMVGSMGCASAMALGVAMSAARPTVVLDGDGALLMRMGNLTTIGSIYPRSFVHIVMDNGGYGTTGGQASSSRITDIAAVAHACNYASIFTCDTKEGLVRAVHEACDSNGPVLIRAHVTDSPLPSRPNVAPRDVAWRFSRYLASSNQQRESNEENT
jgi:phosphonopyruvate decarboxylase